MLNIVESLYVDVHLICKPIIKSLLKTVAINMKPLCVDVCKKRPLDGMLERYFESKIIFTKNAQCSMAWLLPADPMI